MRDFLSFMKTYTFPYKWNVIISVLLNLLTAFFTLFSFAFIIPILQMLFGINTTQIYSTNIEDGSISDMLTNNFYKYISTLIVSHGASSALLALSGMLIGATLFKVLCAYGSQYVIIPMQNGVTRDIRNKMYKKIISLPIGFYTQKNRGDILSRISNDVTELQVSIMKSLFCIIKYPVIILACLGMMITLSWQLTVFVLIILPIIAFFMGRIGKKLKSKNLKGQQCLGILLSIVEETIGGLKVIKAFNASNQMENNFTKRNQELYDICNAVDRRYALAHPLSEFLGTVAVAIILWFGGSLILSEKFGISAPEFIYYMVMFYSIIAPVKELSKTVYTIQKGMAALDRIDKILNVSNPIINPTMPLELKKGESKGCVKFLNVSFSYDGKQEVLKDINLEIEAGSTVALVGISGSGKSTLVDMIPRFWDVKRGKVTIDDIDIRQLRMNDLRSIMGIVSQESILFNDTIFNNILMGDPSATIEQVENAAKIANAHDFIKATEKGYYTRVGDSGCRLSGGERQRISIARAILKNPQILILDEATSALDSENEYLVQDALERLIKGRTTIVIAHRLSTIVKSDKIYVMQAGKIVETGTHNELMRVQGLYRRLVDMQQVK